MPPNVISSDNAQPLKSEEKVDYSKFFKALIEEGSLEDGNCDKIILPEDIDWIDFALLKKGREFVERNYAVVLMAMLVADTLGFITKQIASTVFRNFYPQNVCGMRFLSTFWTTMNGWLLSGFTPGQQSPFVKEIQRVRKLHRIYGRPNVTPVIPPPGLTFPKKYTILMNAVKEDMKEVQTSDFPSHIMTWEPNMYFTQLDVALVQVGMFSPFLLYPEKFGIKTRYEDDEGMRGYFHMWAVIGKMLGLQDKYNLALHPDRGLYNDLNYNLGAHGFKVADEAVYYSIQKMIEGIFQNTMPYAITMNALILTGLKVNFNIEAKELKKLMNWHDWLSYYMNQAFLSLIRYDWFRVMVNFMAKVLLNSYSKIFLKK